ncbi:fimbrillin family protein [Bacteroides cellulosilyticus]|uniref:fimbrillin family protein n=1 Tax=Bacteroides cellulosilyticus TaxID=246787 RepID=UPI00189B2DE5|nr:fimbrillin family protein [Bacteroides cellulosilyticus]
MKRIIPHIPNITAAAFVQFVAVVVLVSAFLLTGCSENELPGDENTDTNHTIFAIEVSDGGYAPAAGEKPDTRATENDYTTQFTAGDKIGVFAVKNGAIVDGVNNLCLVATAETDAGDGSLVWKTEGGETPIIPAGAAYYAYYPWQSHDKIAGKVNALATGVDDFFADLVKNWAPSTNQGTYTDYTGSDLMIASGTPSGKSLSFSMQHKMALVVIDLPKTKYKLTNASGDVRDYTADGAPDTKFNGFTPYRMSDGTYRYLIKPAATEKLSGSYTNATSATAEWEFEASVTAGQYGKYAIDSGTIIEKTHQLQAGDFFMKDGTLLGKGETPTEAQQAACIGIVYWVGDITGEDPLLKRDKPGCIHGLVVSLWDMPAPDNGNVRMTWTYGGYEYVDDWLRSTTWMGGNSRPDDFSSIQVTDKMQGYANTIALKEYNNYVESESEDGYGPEGNKRVKPVKGLDAFQNSHPAPSNSSGWYWPSVYELQYVCWGQGNRQGIKGWNEILNPQIQKVRGSNVFGTFGYWSSTEVSDNSNYAWWLNFRVGNVNYNGYKDGPIYRVRPLLAF